MNKDIKAVVLAAGKGTRLGTGDGDLPKVMRQAGGKPLLRYVLDALSFLATKDIVIVVGYKKEEVISGFPGYEFAHQEEQLGTGHAVLAAMGAITGFEGSVLVCCGDMPAVRRETYEALVREHFEQGNSCTILTGESSTALPYGRIVRDSGGAFMHVVEDADCTPEELKITELNSGVYMFGARELVSELRGLKKDNKQGEYYLTDVPAGIRRAGGIVGTCRRDLGDEIIGVNTLEQLKQVEGILTR